MPVSVAYFFFMAPTLPFIILPLLKRYNHLSRRILCLRNKKSANYGERVRTRFFTLPAPVSPKDEACLSQTGGVFLLFFGKNATALPPTKFIVYPLVLYIAVCHQASLQRFVFLSQSSTSAISQYKAPELYSYRLL